MIIIIDERNPPNSQASIASWDGRVQPSIPVAVCHIEASVDRMSKWVGDRAASSKVQDGVDSSEDLIEADQWWSSVGC